MLIPFRNSKKIPILIPVSSNSVGQQNIYKCNVNVYVFEKEKKKTLLTVYGRFDM